MKIEELESAPIVGNYHHDAHLFRAADSIILSDADMETKVRAIKVLDKLMGLELEANEESVQEYLDNLGL